MKNVIKARRSIRSFKSDEIPPDTIKELLLSAMYAPSPKNKQPWFFAVCTGEIKLKIANAMEDKIRLNLLEKPDSIPFRMARETAVIIRTAPVLILVYYDGVRCKKDTNDGTLWDILSSQTECCNIQSIGAAVQNLMLEAENKNIGSLWVGDILYAYDEIKQIVNIDKTFISGIVLGYADEIPKTPERNINKIQWIE